MFRDSIITYDRLLRPSFDNPTFRTPTSDGQSALAHAMVPQRGRRQQKNYTLRLVLVAVAHNLPGHESPRGAGNRHIIAEERLGGVQPSRLVQLSWQQEREQDKRRSNVSRASASPGMKWIKFLMSMWVQHEGMRGLKLSVPLCPVLSACVLQSPVSLYEPPEYVRLLYRSTPLPLSVPVPSRSHA